jgi:hypothetical protein
MFNLRKLYFLLLAAVLLVSSALAQQTTGTLKGVLTDESGAGIPAANISVSGPGGAQKTAQSQSDGSYTLVGLAPGDYTVRVSFPGFTPFSKTVTVAAGGMVQVPIQLTISTEKQEVTVKGEAGPSISVEPDNNATALVMRGDDLAALPDDPDDLADALSALAGPGAGPNGGSIYIDGFSGGQLPPKESIREIRINQNPFSAEYDKLGFGRIEILTKPGTDKFRGTVYFNDTDAVLDSRNPFASNKPDYTNRNYGGNVSGPITHKASFNLDFQRRDIQNNVITNAFYVDPTSFNINHLTNAVVTPNLMTTITPRLDYQLSTNNTLTVRVEERLNEQDNRGFGGNTLPPPFTAGPFANAAAYNSNGNGQNVMITETSILNPKVVNETRFQFTRNQTQTLGNLVPQIEVQNEFSAGGNGIGTRSDDTRHFELTNLTLIAHGVHAIKFGVRVRRDSDQNNNPQGFNGAFSFTGGQEPLLDSNNNIVYDSNGNEVLTLLTALQQYQRNLQLMQAGLTGAQIQTLGGGPNKFTIQAGEPYVSMVRWDAGPFVQDDWRVRPNFTLSLGFRYEVQTLLSDHRDFAPRLGFAWAPGSSKTGKQKTVIRGGFGIFYDRIGFGPFEAAKLNNGMSQFQYTVFNPTFYPNIPSLSTLAPGQNEISLVDPKLRAEASMETAIGVERQLPKNSTMSVTYTYNRSNHLTQNVPINAPLPGSYNPLLPLGPTNGLFPYGYAGPSGLGGELIEYEGGGMLDQHIIMVGFNTRFSRRVSLQGNYQYQRANDLPSSPTNPYNFAQDWGRSSLDRHHNFTLFGSIQAPSRIQLSPFVTVRSGAPYDVLLGEDIYGDLSNNARAEFAAPGAVCSHTVLCTPLGSFQTYTLTNGAIPANLVPRNYLTMAGLFSVNMRISRVFGFGAPRGGNNAMAGGGGGDMGGGPGGGGPGGGGPGGFGGAGGRGGGPGGGGGMRMSPGAGGGRGGRGGGGGLTEHRFNITVSANVTNILNHLNPGGYQGVITSNQFGEPTSVNTGFGGGGGGGMLGGFGGGGGAANNRRIDLSIRLNF